MRLVGRAVALQKKQCQAARALPRHRFPAVLAAVVQVERSSIPTRTGNMSCFDLHTDVKTLVSTQRRTEPGPVRLLLADYSDGKGAVVDRSSCAHRKEHLDQLGKHGKQDASTDSCATLVTGHSCCLTQRRTVCFVTY